MGWFASKCTGFTPSRTPPCGGAFGAAVADTAADEATSDDMANRSGFVGKLTPDAQSAVEVRLFRMLIEA